MRKIVVLAVVSAAAVLMPVAAPGQDGAGPYGGAASVFSDLEDARGMRWCGVTEGVPELVIRGYEAESRIIEYLAQAQSSALRSPVEEALHLASALAGSGRYDEALATLDAAGADALLADGLFLKALCLDRLRRCADAAEAYGAYAVDESLMGDYALLFASRCLSRGGGAAAGVELLRRLVARWQHSPIWAEAGLELCGHYLELSRDEECVELARRISNEARYWRERRSAEFQLARALQRMDRPEEAGRIYWGIVENYPSHSRAGRAFRAFAKIVRARGRELTPEELYRGGLALRKTGNTSEARSTFGEVASMDEKTPYWSESVMEMASLDYSTKRYSDAAESYQALAREGSMSPEEAMLWVGKCRIRSGRQEEAFKILEEVGRGPGDRMARAEALWEAAREKESLNLFEEAAAHYSFVADSLPGTAPAPASCWRRGFCLYLMGDYEGSLEAFERADGVSGVAFREAQALYWAAKALLRLGREAEARESLKDAASRGPGTYYGARAAWVLATDLAEMEAQSFDPSAAVQGSAASHTRGDEPRSPCAGPVEGYPAHGAVPVGVDPAAEPARWHFERGARLLRWGDDESGSIEIRRAVDLGYDRQTAIDALLFHGAYNRAMRLAGDEPPANITIPGEENSYVKYPLGFADTVWRGSSENEVDPFLALAVIRQESRFAPDAVSWAGAYGLMQLMPLTAKRLAVKAGVRWTRTSQAFDPEINIRLGTMEIRNLFEDFGALPIVLSAYNAGPRKAKEWADNSEGRDLDCYIEMIGYRQTRDYVKLVLRDYLAYLRLYHPSWGPH